MQATSWFAPSLFKWYLKRNIWCTYWYIQPFISVPECIVIGIVDNIQQYRPVLSLIKTRTQCYPVKENFIAMCVGRSAPFRKWKISRVRWKDDLVAVLNSVSCLKQVVVGRGVGGMQQIGIRHVISNARAPFLLQQAIIIMCNGLTTTCFDSWSIECPQELPMSPWPRPGKCNRRSSNILFGWLAFAKCFNP